jgi:PKD repeat protein
MAGIEWGDSAVATSDTFDHFSDAFGGVVGEIEHAHTYTTPDIYTINLKVTDDDLGLASTSSQVEIASLADAAQSVADDLELLLAQQQSDPAVHAQLENALNTLTGGNGAIARFNEDNVGQGINRARHALLMLEQVEDDVDLGSAPLLLVQVCKAGAVLQIEDAKTTASTSSEFQRIATAEALVASGDALVASGQLFEAASSYFHAYQRVSA